MAYHSPVQCHFQSNASLLDFRYYLGFAALNFLFLEFREVIASQAAA